MAFKSCRKSFIFHFIHEHIEFRLPELESVASVLKINLKPIKHATLQTPFMVAELPDNDSAKLISSRTVLVRSVYELLAEDTNYDGLCHTLRNIPSKDTAQFTDKSFRFSVESFGKRLNIEQKLDKIDYVLENGIQFNGTVKLNGAENEFSIVEDYGDRLNQPTAADEPACIYFGRMLANGRRDLVNTYELKKRKVIGNTSMDAMLSLIMSNLALTRPGTWILDPFVGSGSLLVSSAHFGSYVLGTEINHMQLQGRGKSSRYGQKWRSREETIRNNLRQYGLHERYVDVIAADSSQPLWRATHSLFNAVVTDPPYGIRESSKKIDSGNGAASADANSASQRSQYHISQVFLDLLNFSARYLVVGGRLVFWYPVYIPEYSEESLPVHPCLRLVYNCEQVLQTKISRRLLTMEKTSHPADESVLDAASIPRDPFNTETFRDKYFGAELVKLIQETKSTPPS